MRTESEQFGMDDRDKLALYPFVVVRIACRVCSRNGSYLLARLAAKFGARDESARPPRSVFLRLPVASGGGWQAGRFSLRRLPAGPRAASAARSAARARAAACGGQQL